MTDDDKQLLLWAARAYGIEIVGWEKCNLGVEVAIYLIDGMEVHWQPLLNNALTDCMGDALRLAVKLNIRITPYPIYAIPKHSVIACRLSLDITTGKSFGPEIIELYNDNDEAATRLAIVKVAAEIGKARGEQ